VTSGLDCIRADIDGGFLAVGLRPRIRVIRAIRGSFLRRSFAGRDLLRSPIAHPNGPGSFLTTDGTDITDKVDPSASAHFPQFHLRSGFGFAGWNVGCSTLDVGRSSFHPRLPVPPRRYSHMRIIVHVPSQTLDLLDDSGSLLRRYVCSTSRFGLGFEPGSHKTPTGRFRIAEKLGDGAAPGIIFKSRVPTDEIGHDGDETDHVQTRILWLDGLDTANANTKERYIYIHGTNAESALGTPASHGCVRLSNLDVIDLYDAVPQGTEVVIHPE
jgi:hypothetical protein